MADDPHPNPHMSDTFSAFTRSLLTSVGGVAPDPLPVGKISDDMPQELKALLFALGQGDFNLGGWAMQGGYVETELDDDLEDLEYEVQIPSDFDRTKAICIGNHFDHELSIWITWSDPNSGFDIVTFEVDGVKRWGNVERFIQQMSERDMLSEDEMEDLEDIYEAAAEAK